MASVADPGCLSRIPDPIFSIPDPESRVDKIPYLRMKELKDFYPKSWYEVLKNKYPGCLSQIPDPGYGFFSIPIPRSGPRIQGSKSTGSLIRIRNTANGDVY